MNMGVYVKGMEMPENCICCDLSHEDGWCPAKQTYTDSYTFKTCPLVPVPEHGDLIDRDALKAAICSRLCIKSEEYLSPAEATIVNEIFAAPTIIPAEPAREEKN